MAHCEHLTHSHYVAPKVHVCAECVAMGDTWVHLRTCLAVRPCGVLRLVEESATPRSTSRRPDIR